MNLRDLEYALSVAEHLSFSRAAEACNTTQSTLSGQVKKLEEELGVALFERTNRKVMLTRDGEKLLEEARGAMQRVHRLKEAAAHLRDPLQGELRLGAFPTLAPYFFPLMVPAMRKRLPQIKPLFVEEKSELLIEQLLRGELDAALLAMPVEEEKLTAMKLFDESFHLAVARDHPLAKKKKICHGDLADYALLLLEEGHCMRDQALEVCSMHGLAQEASFRATSLETLRSMVKAGSGITLMPEIALRKEAGIAFVPFVKPAPSRSIALVWRKSNARAPLFEQLATLLRHP